MKIIKCVSSHLELLQVRSLHADNGSQELVFQAVPRHCEVDQRTLGLQLRLVVGVSKLGVEDEPETWVVLALLVTNLYVAGIKQQNVLYSMCNKNGMRFTVPATFTTKLLGNSYIHQHCFIKGLCNAYEGQRLVYFLSEQSQAFHIVNVMESEIYSTGVL